MEKRKILVTCALPYANGPIHLGHMVEHIQTDIWVRFQKMRGHDCHFVCADDAHGTPIMLRAKQEGITPEQLINQSSADHQRDFSGFNIEYDNYYSTHSDENKALSEMIYNQSKAHGCISQKVIKQAYDEEAKMFLPDRFIKGSCPNCKSADQYGDNCEVCGKTYNTTDLIDPYSVVSGSKPIEKDTEHYFFELSQFTEFLEQWLASADLQTEVINKLREWIDQGLADWDISRDAPYWGFKIPGTDDKYFYVWLDAPVGYLASFKHLCDNNQLNFDDYWREDSNAEVYHFIGKDIAYFHILFWPAMLKAAQMRRPTGVFCHGFLTVNGQKMSKSRGTFIQAKTYLEHLPAEPLRYYFASKLNASIDDLDLNLEDMVKKTNVDLVGKLVNIASRCAGFIHKRNHGRLADHMDDQALYQKITDAEAEVAEAYEQRQYNKAIRIIMSLADSANQYIDEQAPWVLAKQEGQEDKVHAVCSQGINMYRALIIMLKPVVPQLAARSEAFLNHGDLLWSGIHAPLFCTEITAFKALLARLDPKAVEQLIEANIAAVKAEQDMLKGGAENKADNSNQANEDDGMIEFDQFTQVDLRIATIEDAQHIEGADKLLQLTLNVGELGKKNVFAGIKAYYAPEDLIGKQTLMVANLQPRKMRFGVSEGMVLAAGDGKGLFLLSPDQGATAGMKVK